MIMIEGNDVFPRIIIYDNVEYYLGNELGKFCGLKHGRIYDLPEVCENRILLTPEIRTLLRGQVI